MSPLKLLTRRRRGRLTGPRLLRITASKRVFGDT